MDLIYPHYFLSRSPKVKSYTEPLSYCKDRYQLAKNIREIRLARGYSMTDLSRETGLSLSGICHLEDPVFRSWPRMKNLIKVKQTLGCSWERLMKGIK